MKHITKAKLAEKAWREFSRYIRRRDKGVCITCGKRGNPKSMHAGHYLHARKTNRVSFDERNVNCQCSRCNTFGLGKREEYEATLIERYGAWIIAELNGLKRSKPLERWELEALREKYKQLNKEAS